MLRMCVDFGQTNLLYGIIISTVGGASSGPSFAQFTVIL